MDDPEDNMTSWSGLLYPVGCKDSPPYDKGAFKILINFSAEYPFKPPKLVFKTQIYHPNVDEKGQICFPVISRENWKPTTTIGCVIEMLQALVANPEIQHPLRPDLAEEYQKDRATFYRKAAEHTALHAIKR
uniref:E2 ubiquitin-conjugating enzyme n=1 Tax=Mesocestoides corti TaxID=53468 RepID=A0A5K3FLG5_MESCO